MTTAQRLFAAALTLALLPQITPAQAGSGYSDYSCQDLWTERNQIYKDAGYCFKTRRAINQFGNAGCQYDSQNEVPLTARQKRAVNEIVRFERSLGCSD